ncbi:hypothetical protein LI328DRAFT_156910 [Trichoderma asperelloides]|nr:hypothetical protein LI328DRAFT_156910 [Trichoderma asperelloides]
MIAELDTRRLFSKAFFAAQLKYYGIPFPPSARSSTLKALLRDEVCEGKCDSVPESVVELEAAMRRDYEPLYQKWESEFAAWSAEKERLDDEAFEKCETPSEQASFDIRRFLDCYFLTDGKLDLTKAPQTLVLHGEGELSNLSWKVHEIQGLHTWTSTHQFGEPVTCFIGWDHDEIKRLGREFIDREAEAERARRRSKWEEHMETHKKYIAGIQPKEKAANGVDESSKPFDLDRCVGSYVIRCDAIMDEWSTEHTGDTLSMDISYNSTENMLLAAYNFGILKGTMTLSLSEDPLKEMFGAEDPDAESSMGEDEVDDTSEDDEDDKNNKHDEHDHDEHDENGKESKGGIVVEESTNGKKRKVSLEQDTDSATNPCDNAKKRKTAPEPPPSRRVYLRLEGYETGEGEEIYFPEPGHIDFTSDGCVKFEGLMYTLSYVGENVKFEGYKISDKPQTKPGDYERSMYEVVFE